jgi:hypothetical protein
MSERNRELASFLRSRRARLTPEEVGLPRGGRRRIATLRREDVAWLADVGTTWYTWLEQGRPIKMAAGTLDRIGAALRLDSSESEYLRKLVYDHGRARGDWNGLPSPGISALVRSYTAGHAFVIGPRWDVLICNERYAALLQLTDGAQGLERNGLWLMFTRQRARWVYPDWEATARRMVATFRVEYADYVDDRGFGELLEALSASSPEFATLWSDVDVLSPTRWSAGRMRDLDSGRVLNYETVTLGVPDAPGQMLVFHVPVELSLPAEIAHAVRARN